MNLVEKLLVGGAHSFDALQLLDATRYPFLKKPPQYIRATLYHYDFTRYNTSWVQLKGIDAKLHVIDRLSSNVKSPWWTREEQGAYLPPLEMSNPSVAAFLSGNGLSVRESKLQSAKYADCIEAMPLESKSFFLGTVHNIRLIICKALLVREYYNRLFLQ